MAKPRRTMRSKFIAVAGIGVFAGLALSVLVSLRGAGELRRRSSDEIERGIKESSEEYLRIRLETAGRVTERIMGPARSDLDTLADIGQEMIDREQDYAQVYDAVERSAIFHPTLDRLPTGRFLQSTGALANALAVWGHVQDPDGRIDPKVQKDLSRTALYELMFPAFQRNGASKLWAWYAASNAMGYLRLAPHVLLGTKFENLYPGSTQQPFWAFFFPGLEESWQSTVQSPDKLAAHGREAVLTPPYEDAGGNGMVISMLRPLWTRDRRAFLGAAGIDVGLAGIIQSIESARLAKSGFAFLVQADGNVLAINELGARTLRLRDTGAPDAQGVRSVQRKLEQSEIPEIAQLKGHLPDDDEVRYRDLSIGGEEYILALRRHARLNTWVGAEGTRQENWTMGLVVPKREIYESLIASQNAIATTNRSIITAQIGITLATLLAVLAGIALVARRMTAPLTELTKAARRLKEKDYEVAVSAKSDDEIGELGTAFGAMASEIREHTQNLETLVKKRTEELDRTLAALWSEMELARKIQTVLLPQDTRLGEYDVAAKMVPASNVGGDYYDFFSANGSQWALIGDVSGHGVTSGLIMMMAQTAVRTTLLGNTADAASPPPSRALAMANRSIRSNVEKIGKDQYMTISALRIEGGRVHHAGLHQDILVYRKKTGVVESIETTGVWLGLLDDIEPLLEDASFALDPEDALLLYTDGITEAKTAGGRLGDKALKTLFAEVAPTSTSSRAIVEGLFARMPMQSFDDDVTLMVIRRERSSGAPMS